MYNFIVLLRALAVCLITNSHLDGVYPINISWGGAPGVALFFMITGFLLNQSKNKTSFRAWYIPKIIKIYIPLIIVNIITVAIGYRVATIGLFCFPININLWYVPVLAIIYILYYITKHFELGHKLIIICFVIVVYFISYILLYEENVFFVEPSVWLRGIYGFIAMMMGSMLSEYMQKRKIKFNNLKALICSLVCLFGFLIIKLLINDITILYKIQFLTQAFSVAFAWFILQWGILSESTIKKYKEYSIWRVVNFVSSCSLEIYLIQFPVITYFKGYIFPINLLMICLVICFLSYCLHQIIQLMLKILFRHI